MKKQNLLSKPTTGLYVVEDQEQMEKDLSRIKQLLNELKNRKKFTWPESVFDMMFQLESELGGDIRHEQLFAFSADSGVYVEITFDDPYEVSYELYKVREEAGKGIIKKYKQ